MELLLLLLFHLNLEKLLQQILKYCLTLPLQQYKLYLLNIQSCSSVYSCFDKGCPAQAYKRTRQCRLVLWVERVWR